jgi:hypothetical protein
MLKSGDNGEVIMENRLDGWYIKVGSRLVGNQALVEEVQTVKKDTRNGKLGEMALSPDLKPEILEGLGAVANLGEFGALFRGVYAMFGQVHIDNLTNPPEQQ